MNIEKIYIDATKKGVSLEIETWNSEKYVDLIINDSITIDTRKDSLIEELENILEELKGE